MSKNIQKTAEIKLDSEHQQNVAKEESDHNHARILILRQFVVIPIALLKNLIVLPFLMPAEIFVFKLVQTWYSYVQRADIGVFAALYFHYPREEAAGNVEGCKEYQVVAYRFSLLGALFAAGVAITLCWVSVGWNALLPLLFWAVLILPRTFLIAIFQARGEFSEGAKYDVMQAIAGLVFPAIGILFFGFNGFLWGQGFAFAAVVFLAKPWRFSEPHLKIPWRKIRLILKKGRNLWLDTSFITVCSTVDISVVAYFLLDKSDFGGQYAVAITISALVVSIMNGINSVFKRRITQETVVSFKKDVFIRTLKTTVLELLIFMFTSTAILAATQAVFVFLPQYSESVDLIAPMLFGILLWRGRLLIAIPLQSSNIWFPIFMAHTLHLVGVVGFCTAILYTGEPSRSVAFGQAFGSLLGTAFLWYVARNHAQISWRPLLRYALLLLSVGLWLGLLSFKGAGLSRGLNMAWSDVHFAPLHLLWDFTTLLGGAGLVLLATSFLFPKSLHDVFELLMPISIRQKIMTKIRRTS